jgi:hypothetical protein
MSAQMILHPYNQTRDLEFSSRGISRSELGKRIADLSRSVQSVIEELSPEQMKMEYPEVVLEVALSTQVFSFIYMGA